MNGPGRPTLYKPDYAERARELCILGATNRLLAEHFGVARSTIDQWLATIPEFTSAVWDGREHADLAVIRGLFTRATGYTRKAEKVVHYHGETSTATYDVHVPPDVQACIFWLRNRRPQQWRETAELDDADDEAWQAEMDEAAERVRLARAGLVA